MTERFPSAVIELLRAAGWQPGREVELPSELPGDYEIFPRAADVLREFGGLHIGTAGPGQECATSDLAVTPKAADGLSEYTGRTTSDGAKLYPIGEFSNGHATLLIDHRGQVYMYFDVLEPFADSFDQALCQLLLGLRRTGVRA